jgi:hypothetical protein
LLSSNLKTDSGTPRNRRRKGMVVWPHFSLRLTNLRRTGGASLDRRGGLIVRPDRKPPVIPLLQQRKPIHAVAHVGVIQRQVHLQAGRNDHHQLVSSSETYRRTASGLLPPGSNTRRPSGKSIAAIPSGKGSRSRNTGVAGSALVLPIDCSPETTTGANCTFAFRLYPRSARQRNNALVASLCAQATAETLFPGRSHSSTIASFS